MSEAKALQTLIWEKSTEESLKHTLKLVPADENATMSWATVKEEVQNAASTM